MPTQQESSFEMVPLQPLARSANELWSQLQPEEADGSHQRTTITNCQLGHFRVEEQIGRGGMGAVYRAVDTRLDRVVALKVLSPAQSNDLGSVERFRNEARAAARMDHDNIARVYFVGEDQGLWFIAFEFVHGGNVKELIERRGTINPADAVNYTLQIAQALRHTDAAGVVHRDIKPSNIIITPAGRAKLVDLGLARKRGPDAANDLTVDGTTLGTFDYISPEQAKDPKKVDVRSDIYSLGCTLFHMLTGEPPYPKGTMLQKLLDHQAKGIPNASEKNPRIPQELSAVVKKMMASEPNDRYATPEQLIDDLRLMAHLCGLQPATAGEEQWVLPRRADGWELWKQYRGWIVAAALLLLVVFIIDYAQRLPANAHVPDNPELALFEPETDHSAEANPGPESVDRSTSPVGSRPVGPEDPAISPNTPEVPPRDVDGVDGSTVGKTGSANNQRTPAESTDPLNSVGDDRPFSSPEVTLDDGLPAMISSRPSPELAVDLSELETEESTPVVGDAETPAERRNNGQGSKTTVISELESKLIPAEPFTVMVNGVRRKSYPTLEAACAEATDNASIELAFNGATTNVESPLKIFDKHLRILPAQGYRPTLRFATPPEWQSGRHHDAVRMIEVSQGSLEIYNLDIQFEVTTADNVQQWSLIALHDADELSLRGVSITAVNTGTTSVAIVELTEPVSVPFDESSPSPAQINVEDTFVRGHADFILDRNVDPKVLWLSNVAVALEGTLVRIEGTDQRQVATDMNENHVVQLELKNVTAWLNEGLVSFNVQPSFSVPELDVEVDDCVIAIASAHPLIKMQGHLDLLDFEDRLEWSDQGTFLQSMGLSGEDSYWQISSSDRTRSFNRDEFDSRWNRQRSVTQRVTTQLLNVRSDVPFAQILPADLALVQDPENPALGGAIDGTDAGVDWEASRLQQLPLTKGEEESPPEWP